MNRTMKVFIDFDGTIAVNDLGNQFFRMFGGPVCTELVRALRAGELSAPECFRRELDAVGTLDWAGFQAFVISQPVDPGFAPLIHWCRSNAISVTVLSDGLDAYVRPILEREGFADLPVVANPVFWSPTTEAGHLRGAIGFPYANAECDRCGCCKRNMMLDDSAEGDILVYVGDGFSDRCPVVYADIVFAKGDLQTWCREQNISYVCYRTLTDVRDRLARLRAERTLRARPRAVRARREAYLAEA